MTEKNKVMQDFLFSFIHYVESFWGALNRGLSYMEMKEAKFQVPDSTGQDFKQISPLISIPLSLLDSAFCPFRFYLWKYS